MDERLGICGGSSKGLTRILSWLTTLVPYGKAAEVARKVGQIETSDASIWDLVQKPAPGGQNALNPITTQKQGGSDSMGIAMDGCMVNIRGEGWKEVKIGVVFLVNGCKSDTQLTPENDARCIEASYVAHLGGPEGLSNQLAAEAYARGFHHATQQAVIGDGADWIWNIAANDYPNAAQIHDWYHASQHVHAAAAVIFPEQPHVCQAWAEAHKSMLFAGDAKLVAQDIASCAAALPASSKQ